MKDKACGKAAAFLKPADSLSWKEKTGKFSRIQAVF